MVTTDATRAHQLYDQTWEQSKHLFPARAGPPPVRFLTKEERYPKPDPHAAMWVELDDATKSTVGVFITPGQQRAASSKERGVVAAFQKRLLHEWRHFHQPWELLAHPDRSLREADASQFARYWGPRLFGRSGTTVKVTTKGRAADKVVGVSLGGKKMRKTGKKTWKSKQ